MSPFIICQSFVASAFLLPPTQPQPQSTSLISLLSSLPILPCLGVYPFLQARVHLIIVIIAEKLIIKSMFTSFLAFFSSKRMEDDQQYIRFTYRSNIKKLFPSTYYDSDSGWGCMLRVTQMALANLLFKKEEAKIETIAPLFWDNSDMPFSLQTLTDMSRTLYPHKKEFEWFTPCEAGFIFKKALQNFNLTYSVSVCNDNSLFLSEIQTNKDNAVILIMSRIGLDKAEKDYLQALTEMMNSKYFFAILGGTPRYAHLFFKHRNGYFGYLDPHETKKCPEELEEVLQKAKENIGHLEWIKKQKICSSMCIMYTCKKEEIANFWEELVDLRLRLGEKFFLYIDQKRPEVGSDDGIIQIIDIDEATN